RRRRARWVLAGLALAACRPPPRPLPPAPPSARDADLIYFVMVDRFADGLPDVPGSTAPDDPHGWHGGDLAGLREKLPYLDQLGVGTVWISPISRSRQDKINEWGAFHGYWVHELGAVEPRFGDADALAGLAGDLHARGMRLVLDVVWNHVGPGSPLLLLQPGWFHQAGDVRDWSDPVQRVTGDVHGLPDLAQELPAVEDHLLDATLGLVNLGVDGLRVDAVGHMPLDALARLNDRLDAARPGGVWTLAEDFTGDPLALRRTVEGGHFDAIFDFALRYALIDAACRGQPARLAATLELDRLWAAPVAGFLPGQEAPQLITFLDNHDTERLIEACGGDARRADAALLLLFALRGTPSLTWGTEALLPGAKEPATRASMPWGQEGRRAGAIAGLQAARAHLPALRSAAGRTLSLGPDHVLLERVSADQRALVLLSTGREPARVAAPAALVGQPLRLCLGPGSSGVEGHPVTHLPPELRVSAGEVAVWVLDGAGELPPRPVVPWPARAEAALQPGEELRVVGAGPELGGWDPARGVALRALGDGVYGGDLPLPLGGVPAMKLVAWRAADGAARFEPGPDRSPLLPGAAAPLRLPWGAPTEIAAQAEGAELPR
ncbi:MAG: hypothetical protein RL071_3612, partial [Pseudomonadota bacterium]